MNYINPVRRSLSSSWRIPVSSSLRSNGNWGVIIPPIVRSAHFEASSSHRPSEKKWLIGWRKWFAAGALGATGYSIGSWNFQHFPKRRDWLSIEEESASIPEYRYIHNHPFVKKLREDPDVEETRYYDQIPILHRENMLTTGLLAGKGVLTVEPLVFSNAKTSKSYVFYHVGDQMDGHDGIVHGGLLATLMDEGLTRCGFPFLPAKYGVTASLNLNYRAPVRSNSYIVLESEVEEAKGRKVSVKGKLESLPESGLPVTLVEGDVVLVEPKWARYVTWLFRV